MRFGELRPGHLQAAAARVAISARNDLAGVVAEPTNPQRLLGEAEALAGSLRSVLRARGDVEALRSVLETLRDAHGDPDVQARAAEVEGSLPSLGWPSSRGVLDAISELAEFAEQAYAEAEKHPNAVNRRTLAALERALRDAGFGLDEAGARRLEALAIDLAELARRYRENVVEDTRILGLCVRQEGCIGRMPQGERDAAARRARERGQSGFWFPMCSRSAALLLRFCDDVDIRREVVRRLLRRGLLQEESNLAIASRMVAARHELARLLGYARFGDYARRNLDQCVPDLALEVLVDRRSRAGGRSLLLDSGGKLEDPDARDDALVALADSAYESQLAFERAYGVTEAELRPYFTPGAVLRALVTMVGELFGVHFAPAHGVSVWHPEVRVFDAIVEDGTVLARVFLDLFARSGKREGARTRCATFAGAASEGPPQRQVFLVADLPGEADATLAYDDVLGLAHELGHVLHACLAPSGTLPLDAFLVGRDTLEFPARLLEQWWLEEATLERFLVHPVTGVPMPERLRAALIARERQLVEGRRAEAAALAEADLRIHTEYCPAVDGDLGPYSRAIKERHLGVRIPHGDGWMASAGDPHLFSNPLGYAGTYDAYLTSEEMAAAAFERVRLTGLFDVRLQAPLRALFGALSQETARRALARFDEDCRVLEGGARVV